MDGNRQKDKTQKDEVTMDKLQQLERDKMKQDRAQQLENDKMTE